MNGARDLDLDLETDETWEDWHADWDDAGGAPRDAREEAERWRHEQAELRHMLGMDDASGYSIVGDGAPGAMGTMDASAVPVVGPFNPPVRQSPGAVVGEGTRSPVPGRPAGAAFPCLEGVRYRGCLGLACPLETCWTGATTVSYAAWMREGAHVSTALYLPGAPCHGCACLHEDTAPARAPRPPATTPPDADEGKRARARDVGGDSRGDAAGGRANGGGDGDERGGEDRAAGRATLRRISCTRGLWAHPTSLSSFVTGRIPMRDADEPGDCPSFVPRPAPHPAVAAHLERRRERAKRQREERRAGDG